MNWKINYWTLLCFIMVGGLIFSCMDNSKKEKKPISMEETKKENIISKLDSLASCPSDPDTISAREAWTRIDFYRSTMASIKKIVGNKIPGFPSNFGEGYIKLPKCELLKMIEKIPSPDKNVYIYLTIEASPEKREETMMSAVFAEKAIDKEDIQLAKTYYFDFMKPCPPACDN